MTSTDPPWHCLINLLLRRAMACPLMQIHGAALSPELRPTAEIPATPTRGRGCGGSAGRGEGRREVGGVNNGLLM